MDRGKQICKTLKELRLRIAEANGVPFETEECTHKEPCQGTCPKCEQEVHELEAALREKERRGEAIILDGIVNEQEFQDAFKSNWQDASENTNINDDPEDRLAGIPARPNGERVREAIFRDLKSAVEDCLKLSESYHNVALYIDPFDHTTLVTRFPSKEQEALFAYDYCDWRQFVRDNEPCLPIIRDYVEHRITSDSNDSAHVSQGVDREPLENLEGYVRAFVPDNQELTDLLFNQLSDVYNVENLLFSPLGVASILEMLQCGTEEKSSFNKTIGAMLAGFKAEDVKTISNDDTRLEHATSMWYDQKLGIVKKTFVDALFNRFDTEPQNVDFKDVDSTKAQINNWANRNTHGLIPQLKLNLSADTFIVLADALYLKAKWELPFNADNTRKHTFYNADGSTSRVDMMCLKSDEIKYEAADEYQVVELHYTDELYITIVLPRRGHKLIDVMKAGHWLDVYSCNNRLIELRLPKFKIDTKIELKDTLSALGLADLFDKEDALTEITDESAHVSRICQQCSVAVDEEGSEAATVTFAECEVGCLPPMDEPKPIRMTIDRPFGFVIKNYDEVVLFMGVVNHLDDAKIRISEDT